MRWSLIVILAAIALVGSASARPTLEMAPEMTTKVVFDACSADDASGRAETCDRLFEGLMRVARDASSSPDQKPGEVCFPDGVPVDAFRSRIMAWVRDHPDLQPMDWISDGSRLAFIGAYACH